jgi:hypothetical protein
MFVRKGFAKKVAGLVGLAVVLMGGSGVAHATDLFTVTVDAGAIGSRTQNFSKIADSFDFMNTSNLQAAFNGTSFDPFITNYTVSGLYRGLNASFSTVGNTITMNIPAINFTKSFVGVSRDDAVSQIKDWFKKDGGAALDALFSKFAELTPIDPIAGNPNSIQAKTVSTAYDRGFTKLASQVANTDVTSASEADSTNANQINMALKYNMSFGDYKSSSYTIPLGYTWRFNDDVRHQISFDLPINYTEVEKGQVIGLGFGLGYSHPLSTNWVLSAGVDYGATASIDLGSGGHVLTSSLASLYSYTINDTMKIHMGNMVGYSTTLPVNIGDYSSDPGIENYILRNGFLYYVKTAGLMDNTGIELFVIDTRYLGTKLYNDNYQEVGLSFGFDRTSYESRRRSDKSLRIGVTSMIAKNNNGVMLNFGYSF